MSAAQTQLVHFLSDLYSVEQQALAQLVSAPDLAGDPTLAEDFRLHYRETQSQAELVHERLEFHGGNVSALKEAIMKLGGKGFLLFAATQPETPGKLVAHAYAYEAMEWAGYELLRRFAELAGDAETEEVAVRIGKEERAMMERLERGFDQAERASHRDTTSNQALSHLRTHLEEAHALETQGVHLLQKAEKIAGGASLTLVYQQQLEAAEEHARLLEQRLETLGDSPSTWKDAALGIAGLNWGMFFQAQPDTPAKLAAFAYAFQHLKLAGYELLSRTAKRFNDPDTQGLSETFIAAERKLSQRLVDNFDLGAEATIASLARN